MKRIPPSFTHPLCAHAYSPNETSTSLAARHACTCVFKVSVATVSKVIYYSTWSLSGWFAHRAHSRPPVISSAHHAAPPRPHEHDLSVSSVARRVSAAEAVYPPPWSHQHRETGAAPRSRAGCCWACTALRRTPSCMMFTRVQPDH